MERYHQINRTFAGINIASLFAGMAYRDAPISLNIVILVFFLIFIRAKFWLDDEAYLEDVHKGVLEGGLPFAFGICLAVASWVAFAFAGFFVKDIEICSLIMLAVFALSTFWIVAAMIKRGAYAEQIPWLFFNCFYSLCFFLIAYRKASWNPFQEHAENFTTAVIILLFIIFFSDLAVTRILEQKRRSVKAANGPQAPPGRITQRRHAPQDARPFRGIGHGA